MRSLINRYDQRSTNIHLRQVFAGALRPGLDSDERARYITGGQEGVEDDAIPFLSGQLQGFRARHAKIEGDMAAEWGISSLASVT